MAEIKNSFISSKMNKDLDDRLIPSSQYRDALNIEVGKSETNDIGVLQNVLGNLELTKPSTEGQIPFETAPGLTCIGYFADNQNNRLFQFLTNYTDQNPEQIIACDSPLNTQPTPVGGWVMKITMYDANSPNTPYTTLVSGTFLNFSTTNIITGVNLIENLLFWTDNRNQPRKINITSATNSSTYYTDESQISVAKYAPFAPISLVQKATATVTDVISSTEFEVSIVSGQLVPGMTVLCLDPDIPGSEYIILKDVDLDTMTNTATITLYSEPTSAIVDGTELYFLISTMSNNSNEENWPGDPSFLEDKYVRFSYRFKFDDNEYSLLAPFTQIVYVPKQKGYFINNDETAAYRSTVVEWMENNANNIELLIPLPCRGTSLRDTYKITKIEILYKESNLNQINVIDSIPFSALTEDNIYSYTYKSQKPYKTLSPDQTVRVYDNVPVRALSQESAGNRIIYGNFFSTYTAPASIDYNTLVNPKQSIFDNFIEYPNHTVKQNRNYQVGFVLSDKFGRSSSVILSSFDALISGSGSTSLSLGGSTIYAPYQSENEANFPIVKDWFGNALVLLVNSPIVSTRSIPNGTPGLYAVPQNDGFAILSSSIDPSRFVFTFDIDENPGGTPDYPNTIPTIGQYLRGKYTDYVKIVNVEWVIYPVPASPPYTTNNPDDFPSTPSGEYIITAEDSISDLYDYNPDITLNAKFAYELNQIGWYSYKVVVKQQQQDYYNVYLPGMLQGYPTGQTYGSQVIYTGAAGATPASAVSYNGINVTEFPVGEIGKTSHIVLINDNINKVPRDLSEVGPDQKQYRSSAQLFGKVQNRAVIETINPVSGTVVTNPFAKSLTYSLVGNDWLHIVKIGDGIQCVQQNEPVPNPAYPGTFLPNPERWYANTVVTSNIIDPTDPTQGIITWEPGNWTRDSGPGASTDFIITRAENVQYFPTRKADTVTSIANALDFNFLSNDVDNIKGSASLNLYQLQTNPLIGRISTVNPVGAGALEMVPFLSVYETTPEVTNLALFWETATTGYISDLNWDVLTGFDGPARLSTYNFEFWENQDPEGDNPVEGQPDSKYITSEFKILNATGVPLFPTSVSILSVSDNSTPPNNALASLFGISADGNDYRLFINSDNFIFNNLANDNSNFDFVLNIDWNGGNYQLPINGRLQNIAPSFLSDDYNTLWSQVAGNITTITATNGTFLSPNIDGLAWDIIDGDPLNYFSIATQSGQLSLVNPLIPVGAYTLTVRVRDAMNFSDPNNPQELQNAGAPNLSTKEATIEVVITIGAEKVNDFLQYYNTEDAEEPFIWGVAVHPAPTITCALLPGQGNLPGQFQLGQAYGAIYIGQGDYPLNELGMNPGLPVYPGAFIGYQKYVSVPLSNGAVLGGLYPPTGLTKGALEWTIKNYCLGTLGEHRISRANFILYYRAEHTGTNSVWVPIYDDNASPSDPAPNEFTDGLASIGVIPPGEIANPSLEINVYNNDSQGERETVLVTSSPGEYCLVIKNEFYQERLDADPFDVNCNSGNLAGMHVMVKDANYNYDDPAPDPGPPVPIGPIEYFVGAKEYISDYPTGMPFDTQDATLTFNTITYADITTSTAGTNELNLSTANFQLVKGLAYAPTYWYASTGMAVSLVNNVVTITGGGNTNGLLPGMRIIVTSGPVIAANTVVVSITNSSTFVVTNNPSTNWVGSIKADNAWIDPIGGPGSLITDVTNNGTKLILNFNLQSNVIADIGAKVAFRTYDAAIYHGSVWTNTDNGLHVNQFYSDSALTLPWEPPVADKFYIFQNAEKEYDNIDNPIGDSYPNLKVITKYPYFCAKFDGNGKVIRLDAPEHTVLTAWKQLPQSPFENEGPLRNHSRNLIQNLLLI